MLQSRQVLRVFQKSGQKFHTSSVLKDAAIINGRKIADDILEELRVSVDKWKDAGNRAPKLVGVIIGDNPASAAYVKRKVTAAERLGMTAEVIKFNTEVTQNQLLNEINMLNNDPSIDGIIVQLPVPEHINEREASQAVVPNKDVDGFHLENMGSLVLDTNAFIPATALGVKELIVRSNIETFGKNAVVVGRSKHVGLPIALLLHGDGKAETRGLDMTTTICHRYTPPEQLRKFARSADVLVVAAGVPGLITADMIKENACVIDVGITRVLDPSRNKYKLVGDVDFESAKRVAGHISPVPGGVGPMTVAMLMKNTLLAAMKNKRNTEIPAAASAQSSQS